MMAVPVGRPLSPSGTTKPPQAVRIGANSQLRTGHVAHTRLELSPVHAVATGAQADGYDPRDIRAGAAPALALPKIGDWQPPNATELEAALSREPALKEAITRAGAGGKLWLQTLAAALATATRSDSSANGGELLARFEGAYGGGRLAHVANGSVWRDSAGALNVAFLHQESLPDVGADGNLTGTYTGRIYPTFDTSGDHPGGFAPVVEGLKLVGLPEINVFPNAKPQSLPQITQTLRTTVGDHVYAPSPTWPGVKEGKNEGKPKYAVCFMITDLVHEAMVGRALVFPDRHTLDTSVKALADLACIDISNFREVNLGRGKSVPLDRAFSDEQPQLVQQRAMVYLSSTWGTDRAWQVPSIRKTSPAKVTFQPSESPNAAAEDVAKEWSAIQFSKVPSGLTFDGAPVRVGVTYSREEFGRMQAQAKGTVDAVIAYPKQVVSKL